ncbi:MAG: LacI family DNA-binding transcriptional regulator [Verrucomicrobia bacterium]|nr:LacI family DNA-binding transcriptional regulator [Verrucomicrobiota bacterium]MCH8526986.1 LacI family transcriptional regulator [Kiritimatiellia bacterium]
MPVSIEEVAQKSGVSPSTVSLALRGLPRVAPETRDIVLKTVKELGYVHNPPGRPKKDPDEPPGTKRTNRIALIVPGITLSTLYAPVYADLLHGVENAVNKAGKIFILRHLNQEFLQKKKKKILPATVDGALMFGGTRPMQNLKELKGVPVVQMMRNAQPGEPWDRVTYDNRLLGVMAAEYLLQQGHRHTAFIGHICGDTDFFFQQRGIDFKNTVQENGGTAELLIRDLLFITRRVHGIHQEAMLETLDALMALKPRPTAVFTEADMVAQALYSAMHIRGLTPGKDLTVISCNNEEPILATLSPIPASLDIHASQIGKRAVQQLLWRIENPDEPPQTIKIPPALVEGGQS